MTLEYNKELAEKNQKIWRELYASGEYSEYLEDLCKRIKIILKESGLNIVESFAVTQMVSENIKNYLEEHTGVIIKTKEMNFEEADLKMSFEDHRKSDRESMN